MFLGAGLGGVLRYGVGLAFASRLGQAHPWATLLVNLVGSLAIGLAMGWLARHAQPEPWRALLVVGVLGGFTTFSAFSYELVQLAEAGRWGVAGVVVGLSLTVGPLLAFVGYRIAGA